MVAKTNKQKQADYKNRMTKSGFVQLAFWIHIEDKDKVRKYIEDLKKERMVIKSND